MPRYEPNTRNSSATLPVFEKDTYEFAIRSFKPSKKTKEKDNQQHENINMLVTLECVSSGPMQGKKVLQNFIINNADTFPFFKRFMMAAYDFPVNDEAEERFNEEVLAEKDDSFDPDTGEYGSYYKDAIGNVIIGDTDTPKIYNGQRQNNISWRGVSSSIPASA